MTTAIMFYHGTKSVNSDAKLFDRLICWWTKSPYSHTESVVGYSDYSDIERIHLAGGSLYCWSASLNEGKVRPTLIYPTKEKWTCVVLEGYDKASIRTYWESVKGSRYDYPGVLGFVFKFIKQVTKWIYCSEGVAAALIRSALPGVAVPPEQLTPGELFEWAILQPNARVITFY